MEAKKQVLISPLNWGLGHATRITPVIRKFLDNGWDVVLAADGIAYSYLLQEFPSLPLYQLPGIKMSYGRRLPLWMKMAWQIPRIFLGICREHRGIQKITAVRHVDLIVSDNRYGLWHKTIPAVFVTHQIYIRPPLNLRFLQPAIFYVSNYFMKRFTFRWVPDFYDEKTLSGKLSHPAVDENTYYIGPLSRLKPQRVTEAYDFVIMLSGPEPQRTLLEKKIAASPGLKSHRVAIIRGLPGSSAIPDYLKDVETYNHLSSVKLSRILSGAAFVISRSGYSTVMDLYYLNKPAVFIPTPGQTEQEYLAQHLEGDFYTAISQKSFSLEKAIASGKRLAAPQQSKPFGHAQSHMDEIIASFNGNGDTKAPQK